MFGTWNKRKYLRHKRKHPEKPVPLLLLTKISASRGISCPSWAIVQSKGFKENLEVCKRIAEKSRKLNKINAR